ncbi:hypothetical protein [Agaribacterium sp. ZY112]|uniref:hypothetical protein n=1 Tax=Agaribacterium sp. ZY112 TaxID=3233574 RepID=UPI0035232160
MVLRTFFTLMLISLSNLSLSETTLQFVVPETDISTSKIYKSSDFMKKVKNASRGSPAEYAFEAPERIWSKKFRDNSYIDREFKRQFIDTISKEWSKAKAKVASDKKVQRAYNFGVDYGPLVSKLRVKGRTIEAEISGLKLYGSADFHTEGIEDAVCGSKFKLDLGVRPKITGVYNLETGYFSVRSIKLNESYDYDCNNVIGRLVVAAVKPALNIALDRVIPEMEDSFVSQLSNIIYVGPFSNILSNEVVEAGGVLGVRLDRVVWDAFDSYVDGTTLEMHVGADYYGPGKHLLRFKAYQSGLSVSTKSISGGYRARGYSFESKASCPSWNENLTVYTSSLVKTGSKRLGRATFSTYGMRFSKRVLSKSEYKFSGPVCSVGKCGLNNDVSTDKNIKVGLFSCENALGHKTFIAAGGYWGKPYFKR